MCVAWKGARSFNLLLSASGAEGDFCRSKLDGTTVFARSSLLMSQRWRSPAVATMWRFGGSSIVSQGFLWLDAPNCSVFGDVKATFMEQNWGEWTGSVSPVIPREQWGVRSDVRGKTRSWLVAGFRLVLMGREASVSAPNRWCPAARSAQFVASWPKWHKSRSSF